MLIKTLSPLFGLLLLALCFTSCDPETEGVTLSEPDILGENYFDIDGQKSGLDFGYMSDYTFGNPSSNMYSITLTTSDVERNGRLLGRSDMITFIVTSDTPEIQEGSYRIEPFWDGTTPNVLFGGMYCQNMNFATGSADDDVPTVAGTMTLTRQAEEVSMDLDFNLMDGRPMTGHYEGELKAVD